MIPLRELIVDSFAGGGGASLGLTVALGREPDAAVNHDATALAMHRVNHPATLHLAHDVWRVDPRKLTEGHPVGVLWASPDCKHHSKAKGGRPKEKKIRDLAWVVVRWAKVVRPRVILLENVEEFRKWGPLQRDGMPCRRREGQTFAEWVSKLERLGYHVDYRELRACDYGVPTTRKRLFMVARCDGYPILWPEPTHGDPKTEAVCSGRLKPWRTAAECLDFSLPCPSIFLTKGEARRQGLKIKRPLEHATLARLARGAKRYVLDAAEPFLVPITHRGDERVHGLGEPLRTITTASRGEFSLGMPFLAANSTGYKAEFPADEPMRSALAGSQRHALIAPFIATLRQHMAAGPIDVPLPTVTAGGTHHGLAVPFLVPRYGERPGQEPRTHDAQQPVPTVVPSANHHLAACFLAQNNTGEPGHPVARPLSTIVGKGCTQSFVAGFLASWYGTEQAPGLDAPLPTATTRDRFSLQEVIAAAPPFAPWMEERARQVADLLRRHGAWDGGEFVTIGPFVLVDIGLRMLTPRELARAQGFPDNYVIDQGVDESGNIVRLTRTEQTRMIGNSVCPGVAAALARANLIDAMRMRKPPAYRPWGAELRQRLEARANPPPPPPGLFDGVAA